jgi:6-phosphogluconolactonase
MNLHRDRQIVNYSKMAASRLSQWSTRGATPDEWASRLSGGAAIPNASGISSYALQSDGTLKVISASVPTLGTANCWSVVTANGRYVYTSNSGSSSIAGFAIGPSGALTPIGSTIVATLPTGAINIDIAASADAKYVYTLNAGNGSVGEFASDSSTGQLTALGSMSDLAAASGLNGIAAN